MDLFVGWEWNFLLIMAKDHFVTLMTHCVMKRKRNVNCYLFTHIKSKKYMLQTFICDFKCPSSPSFPSYHSLKKLGFGKSGETFTLHCFSTLPLLPIVTWEWINQRKVIYIDPMDLLPFQIALKTYDEKYDKVCLGFLLVPCCCTKKNFNWDMYK